MRDWTRTLRPASYKGAGFFVDDEGGKFGRFIATHAFVRAEHHSTEDMGRAPREFRVSAYLASDSADTDARAFAELCSEPGPGILVLPILGDVEVRCTSCHVKAKSDKLGYVAIDLDFIEAGIEDDSFPAAPIGDRLAESDLAEMPDATESRLDGLDKTARQASRSRKLDPAAAAAADKAVPLTTDYQGTSAEATERDAMFRRLFE